MFRCRECKKISKPGESSELVVVAKHLHTFPARLRAHKFKEATQISRSGKIIRKEGRISFKDDPGGRGMQIDKEIRVCQKCAPVVRARVLSQESVNPSV